MECTADVRSVCDARWVSVVEPVFQVLEESGVRYVLVGGLAVVLHGFARLTADIDVIVDFDPEPLTRALRGLESIGLRPRAPVAIAGFADPATRQAWIAEKGLRVFTLWDSQNPLRQVDLFVEHPLDFDAMYARSSLVPTGRATVRVASIDDLITMKKRAARPEDLLDIEALEAIRAEGRTT